MSRLERGGYSVTAVGWWIGRYLPVLLGLVGGLQVLVGAEVGVVAAAIFEDVFVYGGG